MKDRGASGTVAVPYLGHSTGKLAVSFNERQDARDAEIQHVKMRPFLGIRNLASLASWRSPLFSIHPSLRHRDRAFSLVELIVVIGIIALIVAMLLPTLHRARRSADAVKCSAQLYQLGQGLFNYTARNAGWFPAWSGWHVVGDPLTGGDEPGLGWMEAIESAFAPATSSLYNCPTFPAEIPINYFLSARWSNSKSRYAIRANEIRLSTQFVLSGDCTATILYPEPFGTSGNASPDCDKDDAVEDCLRYEGVGGGVRIHPKGLNVLFADGHVATLSKYEKSEITYSPTELKSWDEVIVP